MADASGSVTIIGAGVGGLATAAFLADAGRDVTVLEKNDQLGGRAATFERDGFRFDMGPSWYLMPDVFERFFGHFGDEPTDHYDLTHLDPHYRIFWKDGDRMDTRPDLEWNERRFAEREAGGAEALRRYLDAAEKQYDVGMREFVYTERPTWRAFVDLDVLRNARGLSLLGTMDDHVAGYFDDPKLRQVMQYSLVFLGGAPSKTPALYKLMSHVDFNLGVHYPAGGIGAVIDAIVRVCKQRGVTFVTDAPATSIRGDRGNFAVRTAGDRTFAADVVVSNADYAHTELELLPDERRQYDASYWERRTYAPSAMLLYLGVEGDLEPLAHHSLVLPTDWSDHFATLFDEHVWPTDPAYYVCAPSVTDDEVAPAGHANLFVLVPIAPGLEDDESTRSRFRNRMLADLADNTGVDVRDRIVLEKQFCVDDFATRYNSYAGTALGLAHTLRQTAVFRPNRASSTVDGLYYTGSYTTPGIGVPMCLISGEHTAAAVLAQR